MLFRSNKDIEFIKRITREVIERVVGEKITYYPISKKLTRVNIYGEAKEKIYDPPVELYALVEWLEQDITTNQFGQDSVYKLNVFIHDEHLLLQELKPTPGDVIDYDGQKFEIHSIQIPTQIFGKAGKDIGVQLSCQTVRESQFQTSISGTIEDAARTRPDDPAPTNPSFYDQQLPYVAPTISGPPAENELLPSWSPSDIPNLFAWWRADDVVTTGSNVSRWTDRTGNGRHLEQTTGSLQPTLTSRDSEDVLFFDGGNNMGADWTLTAQPLTYVFFVEPTSLPSAAHLFDYGPSSLNRTRIYVVSDNWNFTAGSIIAGGTPTTSPSLLLLEASGSESAVYHDDLTTPVVSGNAGSTGTDGVTLCSTRTAAAFMPCYMWEAFIVEGILDADTRASLATYSERYSTFSASAG